MHDAAKRNSIAEVRSEVDAIDREIVRLLGRRAGLVRDAVRFKKDEDDIRSPDHMAAFMDKRRGWAAESGEDADFVSRIYRVVTEHSVTVQTALWRQQHPK